MIQAQTGDRSFTISQQEVQDLPMSGRLWIDPATGTVLKTEMSVADSSVIATVAVEFREDTAGPRRDDRTLPPQAQAGSRGRHRVHPPPVAHGIFGIAAGARAHHAVAGLEAALNVGAGLDHLARPVDADRRADAAVAAVGKTTRGREIGASQEQLLIDFGRLNLGEQGARLNTRTNIEIPAL